MTDDYTSHTDLGKKNGWVEVDTYVYDEGVIYFEVEDLSRFDGKSVSACVILTPKKARKIAKHLLAAAKAAG